MAVAAVANLIIKRENVFSLLNDIRFAIKAERFKGIIFVTFQK